LPAKADVDRAAAEISALTKSPPDVRQKPTGP
jgi:hypothetical protein